MTNSKPFVAAAFACENVLREKDDVISAIRIVDIFRIPEVPEQARSLAVATKVTILVALKSGDVKGPSTLTFALRSPDGIIVHKQDIPIVLNGGAHGANIVLTTQLPATALGLHWMDVIWSGDVLTSIPINFERAEAPSAK